MNMPFFILLMRLRRDRELFWLGSPGLGGRRRLKRGRFLLSLGGMMSTPSFQAVVGDGRTYSGEALTGVVPPNEFSSLLQALTNRQRAGRHSGQKWIIAGSGENSKELGWKRVTIKMNGMPFLRLS